MDEVYVQKAQTIIKEIKKAMIGKDDSVVKIMAAFLAKGHILIEDIPGVGKTTLALAFSKAMSLTQNRMQFTPDVMPSDVTGFFMYENGTFQFHKGAIFCNMFLADEINRTSPKTQSALLEVMEEGTVTVDADTMQVPQPFLVIATQNPSGASGTQMLPESQLDRFLIRLTLGYPNPQNEIEIMKSKQNNNPLELVTKVADAEDIIKMQQLAGEVYIHDLIYQYIVQLANVTRNHELIELGISPRGTLALVNITKAYAFLQGRDYVVPDDVADVFSDVAGHRIILSPKARISRKNVREICDMVLRSVKRPSAER